jgi:ATP-dependent Clp protease ATP-binding subunit ClpA
MEIERFTEDARLVFLRGRDLMRARSHAALDVEHVLLALLRQPTGPAATMLRRLGAPIERLAGLVEREVLELPTLLAGEPVDDTLPATARVRRLVDRAREQAEQLGDPLVGTEHVLLAISGEPASPAARALGTCGITQERVAVELVELRHPMPERRTSEGQPNLVVPLSLEQRVAVLEAAVTDLRRARQLSQHDPEADLERAAQRIGTLERQNRYLQELLKITQENLAYTRSLLEQEITTRGNRDSG